jgi:hypothetical protein
MAEHHGCLSILFPFFRRRESTGSGPPAQRLYIYAAHESLLSPAERSFYGVLLQVLKGRYVVFAKVRLCDVLKHGNRQSLNKISQKHVDFVLCTQDRIAPVLAIELDDKSHSTAHRKERDEFVDLAFGAAELPIIHVPVKRSYSTAEVLGLIQAAMSDGKAGSSTQTESQGGPTP